MSYIVERIDMNEALKDISAYEYALIYGMSRIVFCKNRGIVSDQLGMNVLRRDYLIIRKSYIYMSRITEDVQ